MAEIEDRNPSGWSYAFCSNCNHLCPISEGNGIHCICLSCRKDITLDTNNTIVFFDNTEAKLRNLPIVKDIKGEA